MNELIEKVFKKYEHQITTAKKANYFVGIASDAVKDIIDAHNMLFPHQKQTFTTCNSCVLKILAKLYAPMEQWKAEQGHESVNIPANIPSLDPVEDTDREDIEQGHETVNVPTNVPADVPAKNTETVETITPINYSLEHTIITEPDEEQNPQPEQPKKPKTTNKRRKTGRK